MSDLFSLERPAIEEVYPDTFLLSNFVETAPLRAEIERVEKQSPFRNMQTPSGHYTNVALTCCGERGWVSDKRGYRFSTSDPQTGKAWPKMPKVFYNLAQSAAFAAGFTHFESNSCLINHYQIGNKLGSHQDKDESDFKSPIVSVSIGLPAVFQIFGDSRSGIETEVKLVDGDILVWGRRSRLIYHGVKAIKPDPLNPSLNSRFNLTFRKA